MRYVLFFSSKKSDTHLEFDIDIFKQEDSNNPIFYINYAHARINQIFAKAEKTVEEVIAVKLENLSEDAQNLLFSALLLPEVLEDAFESRQIQKVTEYLKSLAAALHKFYNENRIVGSADEEKLLKLFAVTALSLRVGLRLIGIHAKERM